MAGENALPTLVAERLLLSTEAIIIVQNRMVNVDKWNCWLRKYSLCCMQTRLSIFGRNFVITLIARRSRLFAGTRWVFRRLYYFVVSEFCDCHCMYDTCIGCWNLRRLRITLNQEQLYKSRSIYYPETLLGSAGTWREVLTIRVEWQTM